MTVESTSACELSLFVGTIEIIAQLVDCLVDVIAFAAGVLFAYDRPGISLSIHYHHCDVLPLIKSLKLLLVQFLRKNIFHCIKNSIRLLQSIKVDLTEYTITKFWSLDSPIIGRTGLNRVFFLEGCDHITCLFISESKSTVFWPRAW